MADSLAAPRLAPQAQAHPHTPWGGLMRRVLALAAPTTLVAVLQSLCQLVEPVLAARQGTAALAGWAVVLPFALLLQQMSAGAMGGGVVSAIARALGAGKREDASALVLHAVVIALGFALVFAVALAGFPRTILGWIGGSEAAAAAAGYCAWLFGAGAVPAWLANTLASVLRGGGRHALASRVLILGWLGYPPLAWALMEPAGMGLPGAGLAFAVAMALAALGMAAVVLRGGAGFVPTLRVKLQAALFKRILAVGLVACIMSAIANLTTILVTAAIARHGAAAVAAYGVSARLEFLMVPLAFGVGSALTALVGRAVGAGNWPEARRIAWAGGLLALGVTASVGLFVSLLPGPTARFFASDPAVAAIAATAIALIGPALPGFGVGMALYFASMGAGRMRWPAVAACSRIVIAVGGGWVLSEGLGWGLEGQFIAVAFGISAYGLITAASVRSTVWSAR
ncbi:multidrug transporter MatE [Siccirubricoccus sp. KC 17139]|uniref:Multidrug transporter MatE n=1 Tax=Siccirubricoccus soli TaxID=2899147 RepID=A0ABT1D752_9PROT|nr:MATE family efflux transporter [Siccirubricoccus soli]MCO6417756.1 multidrug transporter MatE [Siccirubricoccus soli]MCP2683891.1 MATE family efflux transporter [Siccirubricoccus soli]